jgi:isoamylase
MPYDGGHNDPAIVALRTRQVKNFFTVTLLSAGMARILMGDEVGRTRGAGVGDECDGEPAIVRGPEACRIGYR